MLLMKCKVCGNNVPTDRSLRRASCCKCNTIYVRREISYTCDLCGTTHHFDYEFVTEDEFRKKSLRREYRTCSFCEEEK